MEPNMPDAANTLKQGLNSRHILFITLGSAIGTGLFYGSADAIKMAGPSVLIAYLISGFITFMVLRALGEMALHHPLPGSFGRYASRYISPLAGFITGWSYIAEMIFACLADITVFATYMGFWYPHISPWLWTLSVTLIVSALNLFAVKIYGELEFILSLIKVVAIISMIVVGVGIIFFGIATPTNTPVGFSNLLASGSWFPHGIEGFIASFGLAIFAFGGSEIIGITATEAKEPVKNVKKAINAAPIRILLFYILTIAVLITIQPWYEIGSHGSPFVTMFSNLGIHSAADILNLVVISAAISAINSDIYGASRMLQGLSEEGLASKKFSIVSKRGIPVSAIILMFIVLSFGVVLNFFFHSKLFFIIAILTTLTQLIVWIMILVAQMRMRMKMSKEEREKLVYPLPFWPIGPIFSIFCMLLICFFMGSTISLATFAIGFVLWIIGLAIIYYIMRARQKKAGHIE